MAGVKGSKLPGPRVSLYHSNFLDALTEEHYVIFEETTAFLKHTRMKQGKKRKLGCDQMIGQCCALSEGDCRRGIEQTGVLFQRS
jgi:hypothetical protein